MKIPILVFFFGIIRVLSRKVQISEFADDVSDFLSDVDALGSNIVSPYNPSVSGKIPVDDNRVASDFFKKDAPENQHLESSYLAARDAPVQDDVAGKSNSDGFKNVHTRIVDEIVYETETVYYTHTEAVIKTKCCKLKPHYTKCSSIVPEPTPTSSAAVPDDSDDNESTTEECNVPATTEECNVPATTSECNIPATGCTHSTPGCQCSATIVITATCNCGSTAVSHTCGISFPTSEHQERQNPALDQPPMTDSDFPFPLAGKGQSDSHNRGDGHSDEDGHKHGDNDAMRGSSKNHGTRMEKLQKIELACIIIGVISGIWIVI